MKESEKVFNLPAVIIVDIFLIVLFFFCIHWHNNPKGFYEMPSGQYLTASAAATNALMAAITSLLLFILLTILIIIEILKRKKST